MRINITKGNVIYIDDDSNPLWITFSKLDTEERDEYLIGVGFCPTEEEMRELTMKRSPEYQVIAITRLSDVLGSFRSSIEAEDLFSKLNLDLDSLDR